MFVLSTLSGYNLFRDHYLIDQDDYLSYRKASTVGAAAKEMFDRRFGSVAVVEKATDSQLLVDRIYREEALIKIKEYPDRYVILSLVRGLRLWFNVGYGAAPSWKSYLILAGHLALLGLMIKALISYPGNWIPKMAPAFALLILHTLTYMGLVGEFRYSIPLIPYLIMIGCYSLVCIFKERGIVITSRVLAQ